MIRDRDRLAVSPAHDLALACLEAGVAAAHPRTVVDDSVSLDGGLLRVDSAVYDLDAYDEVLVVGGGNAAGHVAAALEETVGDRISGGAVVTDDPVETTSVEVFEGDHPVPSERNVAGTRRVVELVERAEEGTLLVAAITGGGSALLAAPVEGVSLTDLQSVTDALLRSGADIHEINAVRKHLSAVKGGQLARAAAPAAVVGLVFSDVVGNDLDVVASGPTAPDGSTFADALDVLDRYDVDAPESVRTHLERGTWDEVPETPRAGHPAFDHVTNFVLADGFTALDAARDRAREADVDALVLSSRVRGEAREAAKTHVAIAEECLATGNPADPPVVLLSGGETTVTVRGDGTGGPNQEFAVSAALELGAGAVLACADTDGIDGATDAAGALVDGTTVESVGAAHRALAENDVYPYLDERGALLRTGATGTNVNDLRVLVVGDVE